MIDRETILSEIQRLADANDGVAPGRYRFESETGIREADWLGKYWARWSDAVSEADRRPSEFQGALSEGDVLSHLASATRELGHFPTNAELKMRRRESSDFPSHGVFDRLGRRPDKIVALRKFCGQSTDWADVTEILAQEAGSDDTVTSSVERSPAVAGVVYLMKSGRHYKIGRSNSLGRREYELAIQLPEKVETVHSIETDDPEGIERYWHQRFAKKRANGEWFRLDADDIAAFKRRRRYM